jgi:hypothetical protein
VSGKALELAAVAGVGSLVSVNVWLLKKEPKE